MKVIFLDIDGVLNVYSHQTGRDRYGSLFHKHLVDNLEYIIDNTNAKIVISSTWRLSGLEIMQRMWAERKLPGQVIGVTPFDSKFICRGEEIQFWLDSVKNVDEYVIIDDDDDFLNEQLFNFVQTSGNSDHEDCVDIGYGLTRKCAEQAIKILNRND